jgi:branched-chain amino acid transport system permease protein
VTAVVQTVVLGLLLGGVYALAASGLTLVFGVMNIINVAHGALLVLAAYLTFAIWQHTGLDPILSIALTTPLMFALGWVLYQLTIRPLRGAPASMSVLLTFSLALLIQGVLGLIWGNLYRAVRPGYADESFHFWSLYFPKTRVFACVAALVILTALWLLLTRTWLGRAIRASAQNPHGAALMGIDIAAVAALTFALGVATTGAGGSLISILFPFFPSTHYQWISRLLGVIVLGGMGSLPGAVTGALLMGVAEAITARYIALGWVTAVPYVVIFVVLLVRPRGLFGAATRQDVALT